MDNAACEPLFELLEEEEDESPPRPVKTVVPPVFVAVPVPVASMVVELDVRLTLVGFWAPQGLSDLHALWQGVSALAHWFTHWLPYSWHLKKGIV